MAVDESTCAIVEMILETWDDFLAHIHTFPVDPNTGIIDVVKLKEILNPYVEPEDRDFFTLFFDTQLFVTHVEAMSS